MGRHWRALGPTYRSRRRGPDRCGPRTRPVVEPSSGPHSRCNPDAPCMGVGHSSGGAGYMDRVLLVVDSGPCRVRTACDNGPSRQPGRKVDLLDPVSSPSWIPGNEAGPQVEIRIYPARVTTRDAPYSQAGGTVATEKAGQKQGRSNERAKIACTWPIPKIEGPVIQLRRSRLCYVKSHDEKTSFTLRGGCLDGQC